MCAQPLQPPLEQGITKRGAMANKRNTIGYSKVKVLDWFIVGFDLRVITISYYI